MLDKAVADFLPDQDAPAEDIRDVSFGGGHNESMASHASSRLIDNAVVKNALSKMSKSGKPTSVVDVQYDPEQVFSRQQSQHIP